MQTCFYPILTLFKHWPTCKYYITLDSRCLGDIDLNSFLPKRKEDRKRESYVYNFLNLVWEGRKETSLIAQTLYKLREMLFCIFLIFLAVVTCLIYSQTF
jgi:hypothetical protein